ncbi:Opy2p KNAG_0A07320 [Huiozyma naganishii CBS 8797]|uniref:Membrane anchor Opy2 N-terminal domain-containing protein n=1 Tax=Huiozyma naganishii (strain ATCC MYA-139 / BCRC 22969 / CBS 8797 / KCTC 17520 / NBRC 10181 / NCYC 3082 / Yp74L-3) TaxID=1071383 RepID=J7R0P3_HUIN7|nr:hypothetical protein KNAG_0A07320 [Kazachstania naganishii CBS 8797]CCK68385.1 hypothetical protein KNAG_0A07320 [Kazachstania naganishii CBS 8797]
MSAITLFPSSAAGTATQISAVPTATNSAGCVVCNTTAQCPTCGDDEYCVMTSLTCRKCPVTYCAKRSEQVGSGISLSNGNSTGNSTTTGSTAASNSSGGSVRNNVVSGVVGGVGAGVLFLLVVWFCYRFYWKPRKTRLQEEAFHIKNLGGDISDDDDEGELYVDSDEEEEAEEMAAAEDAKQAVNVHAYLQASPRNAATTAQLREIQQLSVPGDRASHASTVRTGASNILPIAFIPGVTTAGTHPHPARVSHRLNTPGDVRSHITLGSSILEGLDDDSRSVATTGSTPRIRSSRAPQESLTTAVKGGRPRLVQINEEDDDDRATTTTTTGSFILDLDIPESLASHSNTRPRPPIPAARRGTPDCEDEDPFGDHHAM